MTSDPKLRRTVTEVHHYLLGQLNSAIRRPGAFGGEQTLRLYLDALTFVDNREQDWHQELAALRDRGASVSTGVTGAVHHALGAKAEDVMASVFAEIAHRNAWLLLDRSLQRAEHDHIRRTVDAWCSRNQTLSGTLAEFGPPSIVIGSNNPLYPKTLGYGTTHPDQPLIFLHFWNGTEPGAASTWPPDHPEPLLLAARHPGDRFIDEFVFTPTGAHRRQQLGATT
ncbi:hypothetical protein ORV05_07915 [Amycolatopsis cynarae]|uniref:Uncharacterized protein n=1 Tax=Amycolatopsis cynarae TaxID=2995223 RepID=A0ABY7B5W6_9PSEU|nr:hypothetical protein [Amycolatopsis sp. HUAS 11-8]WAL67695.1 hypothetical protein ORV05_07915 [Amycolatopsis sp. HUAS 11-8]